MASATRPSGSAERNGKLWGARPTDWAFNEVQQVPTYEEAIDRVGLGHGQRVLEVGCGTGVFLSVAAEHGAEVYGLDASEPLLEIAHHRVPEADLRHGDMQFLPYEDDAFDVVAGFNSFFFAEDMIAALREAGRVAQPGAPVVIQVWGRRERCDLAAVTQATIPFRPPAVAGPQPAPVLSDQGVLEGIVTQAGLRPDAAFDISWAYEYPDEDTMVGALISPGPVTAAVELHGEEPLRNAIVDAVAPHRRPDGGYRLANEWHFLIARA